MVKDELLAATLRGAEAVKANRMRARAHPGWMLVMGTAGLSPCSLYLHMYLTVS